MNETPTMTVGETQEEIAALVRTLHKTHQRLQELAGGELDAVVHPDGHTYLLHEAQEKLRRNEAVQRDFAARQSSILNALPAHIALLDHEGAILSVNDGWRHFAECNGLRNAATGQWQNYLEVCDLAHGDCAAEAAEAATGIRAILTGATEEFEIEYTCHSPTEQRWFRLQANPLENGGRRGAVVMHMEITANKLAEKAVRQSEAGLATAQRIAHFGSWELDLTHAQDVDANALRWSDEMFRIAGFEPGEIKVTNELFFRLVPPDEQHTIRQAITEAIRTRGAYSIVHRLTRQDGAERIVHERGQICFDELTGQPSKIIGTAHDITDRKQSEEALDKLTRKTERRERMLTTMLSSISDFAYIYDRQGRFLFANQPLLNLWGIPLEEVVGKNCFELGYPDELAGRLQREVQEVFETGKSRTGETPYINPRGAKGYYEYIFSPAFAADGTVDFVVGSTRDITERKRSEEQLRENLAKLKGIFSAAPMGIGLSADRVLIEVNEFMCRMVGYNREELIGQDVHFLYPTTEEFEASGNPHLQVKDDRAVSTESRYRCKDGRIIDVAITAVAIAPEDPAAGVVFAVMDITERKRAEEALRASEEDFRTLADAVPQIVWVTLPDGQNIYLNKRWMDYTGLTLEESLGNGWNKPFHPHDQQLAWDAWQQAKTVADTYSLECRIRRADGVYCWWLIRGEPLLDAEGRILKWFGTCTNVDEIKQAQLQIAEQAALIDETRDAIMVSDLEHRVTFWSKGAERLYGWTAGEAQGKIMRKILRVDTIAFNEADREVRESGAWNGEVEKSTRDGNVLTVDVRWTLIRDAQGQPHSILSINTDITERKKIELQFLRAQRMESIGTLAGGIAHNLNNSLAPITLSLELLKAKFPDPDSQELLELVNTSAKHGADMVKLVLSFARGVEGERLEVQLRHIVRDVEKIVNDTFLKYIEVRTNVPNDLGTVLGDATQLHQVLLNLCVNARDAMPQGGKLTITAQNVTLDAHDAGLNSEAHPGAYVVLEVEDNGTGIPKAILEKIFDPFFTTKEIGKGTGLGLSTSLAIVKSHGGFVLVNSKPGKGTTFKVYLPSANVTSTIKTAERVVDLPRGHGELILVIDDEPLVRQITQQTLEAFGYRVVLAADGAEGVATYATRGSEISAVITDMTMPIMDGPATIQALRKLNATLPIIAASGFFDSDSASKFASLRMKHFLPKPYRAETLLKMLRETLNPGSKTQDLNVPERD